MLFAELPSWVPSVLTFVLMLLSVFLILLVLIQRGKGGGLAGAFGGAGGSSAFGSRAGDTFTRITVITAAVWILLIMILVKMIHPPQQASKGGPSEVNSPGPMPPAGAPEG